MPVIAPRAFSRRASRGRGRGAWRGRVARRRVTAREPVVALARVLELLHGQRHARRRALAGSIGDIRAIVSHGWPRPGPILALAQTINSVRPAQHGRRTGSRHGDSSASRTRWRTRRSRDVISYPREPPRSRRLQDRALPPRRWLVGGRGTGHLRLLRPDGHTRRGLGGVESRLHMIAEEYQERSAPLPEDTTEIVNAQDSMGWLDYHLHLFRVSRPGTGDTVQIGVPDDDAFEGDEPTLPGWEVPIARYLTGPGAVARYEYDFGDGWQHDVTLEAIVPRRTGIRYPRCLAGGRACPPEDCGGPAGYENLLAVIGDPSHEEYES